MSSGIHLVSFMVQVFGEDGALLDAYAMHTVAQPFVERLLSRKIERRDIKMVLYRVPSAPEEARDGTTLRDLGGEYGYMTLEVWTGGQVLYRHPHPVAEVIAEGLRLLLAERAPDGARAASFAVRTAENLLQAAPPPPERADERPDRPSFRLRRLPEEPPPLRRRESFAALAAPDGGVADSEFAQPDLHVYVAAEVNRSFLTTGRFSLDVEEGGFLLGRVFRDEDAPQRYLIEVVEAVPAEHTGASLLHLTFTGESFAALSRRLQAARGDIRLLGWYHTHLFSASDSFGLSSVDVQLHYTTFGLPWQLAGLLNVEAARDPAGRTLRFYGRRDRTMARCTHQVLR